MTPVDILCLALAVLSAACLSVAWLNMFFKRVRRDRYRFQAKLEDLEREVFVRDAALVESQKTVMALSARIGELAMFDPTAGGILKARKQPLFDTVKIPEWGKHEEDAFIDCMRFSDGTYKERGRDTNMTQGGQLGYPLQFDLASWSISFESFSDPADVRKVLEGLTLTLFLGQNFASFVSPGTDMTPLLSFMDEKGAILGAEIDLAARLAAYDDVRMKKLTEAISGRLDEAMRTGLWRHFGARLTLPGRSKHLDSCEQFRVRVQSKAGKLSGPGRLKVCLRGILYGP